MIRMPDFVSESLVKKAQPDVSKKKGNDIITKIKYEKITEGKCAQILHIGPYSDEAKTTAELLNFIEDQGLRVNGLHHEIYLSDPTKTEPGKLKTIIRYPVQ